MSELPRSTVSIQKTQGELEEQVLAQVRQLALTAQQLDGNPPLSDQTFVALAAENSPGTVITLLAEESDESLDSSLIGVLVAVRENSSSPWIVELVVSPNHRQHGVGSALLEKLGEDLELKSIQTWAHGGHPAAKKLAERIGLSTVRELFKLRRDGTDSVEVPPVKGRFTLRSFRVGEDEPAWIKANSLSFAHHPEQGSLTLSDLDSRMAEEWFDPAGFFLAFDEENQLCAYHWTKIQPASGDEARPLGEVYVVGVIPEAQSLGLGRLLTVVGMNHLLETGVGAIMLYVDAENTSAVKLYHSLGFTLWDTDIMYGPQPID